MKFDQVWYLTDEADMIVGIKQTSYEWCDVFWFVFHSADDLEYGNAQWHGTLPQNSYEFGKMQYDNDTDGWSLRGNKADCYLEFDEFDEEIFGALEEMYLNTMVEYITEPICNITEHVYGMENEMLNKILKLNTEIDEYVAEVQKQVSNIEEQKRIAEEGAYAEVKDFLDERLTVAKEIGAEIGIDTEDGYYIMFNYNFANEIHFIVKEEGKSYLWKQDCVLRHTYHDTFKVPGSKLAKPDFDKFVCNWDSIQANIIDQNFYKACTEFLTKKVNKAKEKLKKATDSIK